MSTDEIEQPTLSTGKMLTLFFVLVACCALFFGLGYSMGRSSAKNSAASSATAPALVVSGEKPVTQAQAPPASGTTDDSAAATVPEKENTPNPAVTLASGGRAYYLQVAAVSKQEDAEALVAALRKKQYQVFATSNLPTDKLVHVQVGPFADAKEAEEVKTRLSKDGYSPILKK
jgi:cell division septation protein DedD